MLLTKKMSEIQNNSIEGFGALQESVLYIKGHKLSDRTFSYKTDLTKHEAMTSFSCRRLQIHPSLPIFIHLPESIRF